MTGAYWYPTRGRVDEINKELAHLERSDLAPHRLLNGTLPSISKLLRQAHGTPGFPRSQTRQWIWIASQLRAREAGAGKTYAAAAAAVAYLQKLAAQKTQFTVSDVQDLNWVVGRTMQTSAGELSASAIRDNLRSP